MIMPSTMASEGLGETLPGPGTPGSEPLRKGEAPEEARTPLI